MRRKVSRAQLVELHHLEQIETIISEAKESNKKALKHIALAKKWAIVSVTFMLLSLISLAIRIWIR